MQTHWQDLRYGARMVLKISVFMIIAVIILALGVGARASNFSAPLRLQVSSESEHMMAKVAGLHSLSNASLGAQEERYRTRQSDCRYEPPPGKALAIRKTDTGTRVQGYVASRVVTHTASAAGLEGGELVVCSEYGRVEIIDSDDDQVRLQIRWDAFGEGSAQPGEAAKRVIEETEVQAHLTAHQGRLMARIWHPRLGFTAPGGQPAWVSVRLQVPSRGAYRVRTEAFHGLVAVRRLTLASATLRGAVGEKFKGIPGFIGATELDNVELAGDIDIDNLAGLPGIRPPVAPEQAAPTAPILVKARIASSCQLKAVTGGDINVAIQPDPSLGVRAWGGANNGAVRVAIDKGVKRDGVVGEFRNQDQMESPGYNDKPIRVEVRAISGHGKINLASIPAAPLQPR